MHINSFVDRYLPVWLLASVWFWTLGEVCGVPGALQPTCRSQVGSGLRSGEFGSPSSMVMQ